MADVFWTQATPVAPPSAFADAYIPVRVRGASQDGSQDTFAQVSLGGLISLDTIIQQVLGLLVSSLDFTATVALNGSDQSASLEFVKTWGESLINQVTFQISATARDHDSANGPLTVPALPFYADGITKWRLDLDATGLPPDTQAWLEGDTISFQVGGKAVQTADLAPNFAFRVSGRSIPVVTP